VEINSSVSKFAIEVEIEDLNLSIRLKKSDPSNPFQKQGSQICFTVLDICISRLFSASLSLLAVKNSLASCMASEILCMFVGDASDRLCGVDKLKPNVFDIFLKSIPDATAGEMFTGLLNAFHGLPSSEPQNVLDNMPSDSFRLPEELRGFPSADSEIRECVLKHVTSGQESPGFKN
jgi:hypothetical protein